MSEFFGTDGIRGIANKSLDFELAFKCGNALTVSKENPKIVLCKDTRKSGDMLTAAVTAGILAGGGTAINCGILPTAALSYVVKHYNADYGIVISASHNTYEYNGLKIFGHDGCKLLEREEEEIEGYFSRSNLKTGMDIGTSIVDINAKGLYTKHLLLAVDNGGFNNISIALDCANGAARSIAPEVFSRAGANLCSVNSQDENGIINDNCGSLFPQVIQQQVLQGKCSAGFAFDGDADRVIACDEKGNIVDGDMIIYVLATYFKQLGQLTDNIVVGTSHTNLGIEIALEEKGITLLRSDIGDKYVRELMDQSGAVLGGEQSGHIIIKQHSDTGDGILTAVHLCNVLKNTGKDFSQLCDAKLYPQVNINVMVKDKLFIINNEQVQNALSKCREKLGNNGRVMVRASGTEPKIRIMSECRDEQLAQEIALYLKQIIERIAKHA